MIINPEWAAAAAEVALAAETGVAMRRKPEEKLPPPPAPTVVMQGITGQVSLVGVMMLALAMITAALVIHHGLTA